MLQSRKSVLGPRPHAVSHDEQYRKLIKGAILRHKLKPGIDGWAQIKKACAAKPKALPFGCVAHQVFSGGQAFLRERIQNIIVNPLNAFCGVMLWPC